MIGEVHFCCCGIIVQAKNDAQISELLLTIPWSEGRQQETLLSGQDNKADQLSKSEDRNMSQDAMTVQTMIMMISKVADKDLHTTSAMSNESDTIYYQRIDSEKIAAI